MKKKLTKAAALILVFVLSLSLSACSMGLNDMLILKRAYRKLADMDSVSFNLTGSVEAKMASLPLKAALSADCRAMVQPRTLYMSVSLDMGTLGMLEVPVYLFSDGDALQLRLGLGEIGDELWFSGSIPLPQSSSQGGLDVEDVLTMLQDDPDALSIGETETINDTVCRPFTLTLPGSLLSQAMAASLPEGGETTPEDLSLTVWIAEKDGSPVRLSTDLANVAQYVLDSSDSALLSGLKLEKLPVTVDITGFNDVESIQLPEAA